MKTGMAMGCCCILVVASFWLSGCGSNVPSVLGGRSVSWIHGSEVGKEPLPGIDHANVSVGIWDDGAAIVIWDDAAGSSFGARGMGGLPLQPGAKRKGAKYEGHSGSLVVECYTPDGKTGKVKIGSLTFDLAQGALFLVSTTGPKPAVKQLQLSKLNLKPEGKLSHDQITSELMQDVAKTDSDIRTFFTEAGKPK